MRTIKEVRGGDHVKSVEMFVEINYGDIVEIVMKMVETISHIGNLFWEPQL